MEDEGQKIKIRVDLDPAKAREFLERAAGNEYQAINRNLANELRDIGFEIPEGKLEDARLPPQPELQRLLKDLEEGDPFAPGARPSLGFILFVIVVGWAGPVVQGESGG
jgi:hypothetical protein